MNGLVRQEWALIDGIPRHVSDFAPLAPKDRPTGTCLECKQPVIFKCGELRSHHVAHKAANAECEAAKGEGAEHYNAKLYLASILKQMNRLETLKKCLHCDLVNGTEPIVFQYDQVELEHIYPNKLRADIALLSGQTLVCAIEIFVSHRCEYQKIAFHRENKIPCLEVSAEYAQKWNSSKPFLPITVYGTTKWICVLCQERLNRKKEERASEHANSNLSDLPQAPTRQVQKGFTKEKRKTIALQKIFFINPPKNLPFKEPFITIEFIENGLEGESLCKRLFVWDSGTIIRTLHETYPPYNEQQTEEFKTAYRSYLQELEALYGSIRKGQWMTFKKAPINN
jgi:hypothetical protein